MITHGKEVPYGDDGYKPVKQTKPMKLEHHVENPGPADVHKHAMAHHMASERHHEESYKEMTGHSLFPGGGVMTGAGYHSKAHPGFKAVQKKIASHGYGMKAAGAILASHTRHASAAAKKHNPHLKRVKG
jgi:hypothetical protein